MSQNFLCRPEELGLSRFFSHAGLLTLSHLGLVVATILFSRSLESPDGGTRVDLLPPYLIWIRDVGIIVVSFPLGWLFLLPTHTGGRTEFDVVFSAVVLGLNSILVGYFLSRILRRRPIHPE